MQQFLVLFREPDGRQDTHSMEEIGAHRRAWQQWSDRLTAGRYLVGGQPLALEGALVKGTEGQVSDGPHKVGTEIVGGYLLLNARDLKEATGLMADCPIYAFGGYAEIRPIMQINNRI